MNRHSVWCDRKLADLMFRCPFVNEHHYRRPLLSVSYFLHPFLRFLATETTADRSACLFRFDVWSGTERGEEGSAPGRFKEEEIVI